MEYKNIFATGFCWKCGRQIKVDSVGYRADLFCCEKCENQYERAQQRGIMKSKKDGYGVQGSMH